jgi:hypothetical protein
VFLYAFLEDKGEEMRDGVERGGEAFGHVKLQNDNACIIIASWVVRRPRVKGEYAHGAKVIPSR